eukprot:TRINITY_DN1011_c0_g1_i1.p1 TRINITY_DN1011_c0_g1~~TRINITY_DN1011_c0_g1_i1.p1  ORF type:complete len:298 (-),score=7.11 TRINITY_DN1011_c0_g1_i1:5-898(-)
MKNTFVFFYIFLSYVQCVDIPGCGALKNIKWNSSCMLSSTKQLHNLDQFVFSIKNLLLLDGIFYYLVPPNSSENYKSYMQSKFSRVTNNEIEFQVVDVAYSPLKIQRMVKEVKDYKMGVVFHSGNIKTFSHPQLVGLPFFYEPAGHLYHLLTRAFENSKTIETYRNSTMLLTTVSNQSNIDWETGTSMNCFSSDGLLHLSTSKLTRNTLYILRHVLIYLPDSSWIAPCSSGHPKPLASWNSSVKCDPQTNNFFGTHPRITQVPPAPPTVSDDTKPNRGGQKILPDTRGLILHQLGHR